MGRVFAHRFSYEMHKGTIAPGLVVAHSCDTASCVNPEHLAAVPPWVNSADMVSKGRSVKRKGEYAPTAKLTTDDVLTIRVLFVSGMTKSEIAKHFEVTDSNINRIVRRLTWKHV